MVGLVVLLQVMLTPSLHEIGHSLGRQSSGCSGWEALIAPSGRQAEGSMPHGVRTIRVQGGGDIPETNRFEPTENFRLRLHDRFVVRSPWGDERR
jgi:hypothetical protein